MDVNLHLRDQHGDVFVSHIPDGPSVPWRPLTVQEFLEYDELIRLEKYPTYFIEDEVFRKCVQDKTLVNNIGILKAGIVSTVAATIMAFSGPSSIEDIEETLNIGRARANNIVHELMSLITQAFPAYTPEQVYELPFSTFMLRAAQAEIKLLRLGILAEPITVTETQKQSGKPKPRVDKRDRKDLLEEWNKTRQQMKREARMPMPIQPPPSIPEFNGETTIVKKDDILEHSIATDNEFRDSVVADKVARETAALYPDYLEQMRRGEQVKIPSVEERIAVAKKRSEAFAKVNAEKRQEAVEAAKEERKRLLKIRAEERKRRAKKAASRRR